MLRGCLTGLTEHEGGWGQVDQKCLWILEDPEEDIAAKLWPLW